MIDPNTELERLRSMHSPVRLLSERGHPVVLLPAFSFRAAGQDQIMDLLLVPWAHSGGYPTRLFFERALRERGQNWTEQYAVDRKWWTPSWNGVPATLSWREMLGAHIRGVA
jgi:hypothetical protein